MTKPRKKPTQRHRALLQKENGSMCPFCPSQEVDTFEIHHINGVPDDDRLENQLMVCRTCHAKITAGTITLDDVVQKKKELTMKTAEKTAEREPAISNISVRDAGVVVVGNNNRISTVTRKKRVNKYPPDCIGYDSMKANYVNYLIDRYQKLASWRREGFSYAVFPTQLKRRFKIGSQRTIYNLTLDRFDELVAYIQERILNTQIGRMRGGSQKLFDTFGEYSRSAEGNVPPAPR